MMQWTYVLVGLAATALTAQAQLAPNLKYDGRPTMARLRYTPVSYPSGCQSSDSPAGPGWGHDYPMSVQGLLKAATELTSIDAAVDSNLALTVDDPELMKHPVAMLTEPGCWDPTDKEAKALRTYLLKGGFLLVDDPTFGDCSPEHCEVAIQRFEEWMRRVLPEGRIVLIPPTDPIFDGFFLVDSQHLPPLIEGELPEVRGVYENNDPTKRLMVVANYRNALGHRWRYVGNGLGSGIEEGGALYKLGLNYLIYALSH